ncbi:hypothetical protein O3M35_003236 [Rhynocoris fuscipes]|uniref:Amino acid transporter transmembrane domain-containing protein n=1 Tax=Rhynocoris fuscipes TaxID=488301 RepID=A0AAW1CMD5_9HEMI
MSEVKLWSQNDNNFNDNNNHLTLFFATCCIIDLFGIFPVIALPRTIIDCGWIGIPLALFLFFIQIYTSIMLGRCWIIAEKLQKNISEKQRYPYSALMELAYGRNAGRLVTVILGLAVIGACVPNLILASQNLQLIGLKLSTYQMDFSYCYWLLILGLICCPLMWIGTPKDLKWVGVISAVSVLSTSLLTWYCLMDTDSEEETIVPPPSWKSVVIAYGILAFQFDVHPMLLTIQVDMKNKNELGIAILIAFLISGGLFLITSALCYTRYGTRIHYNTLQGLDGSTALYVDFVIVCIQIVLSVVVGASPLFQDLEEILHIPSGFGWKRCVLRTLVVLIAVTLAEAIPRFDLIMGLLGGSLMGQLMFIYPPLMYNRLRSLHARSTVQHNNSTIIKQFTPYGTVEEIPTSNRALVFRSHRADLGMEDRLDDIHFLERKPIASVVRSKSFLDMFYLEKVLDMGRISMSEKMANITIITLGVTASAFSTYFTLSDIIEYADFTPPCITNVSLASKLVYSRA